MDLGISERSETPTSVLVIWEPLDTVLLCFTQVADQVVPNGYVEDFIKLASTLRSRVRTLLKYVSWVAVSVGLPSRQKCSFTEYLRSNL